MEKEFVPYEQALALKELEFDEPCISGYSTTTKQRYFYLRPTSTQDSFTVDNPTYSHAFRWFREKHNLHNGIYPYYDEYEFQIKDFRLPTSTPINGGLMPYEEAELECLKKLIEIVKNK